MDIWLKYDTKKMNNIYGIIGVLILAVTINTEPVLTEHEHFPGEIHPQEKQIFHFFAFHFFHSATKFTFNPSLNLFHEMGFCYDFRRSRTSCKSGFIDPTDKHNRRTSSATIAATASPTTIASRPTVSRRDFRSRIHLSITEICTAYRRRNTFRCGSIRSKVLREKRCE